MKNIIESDVTFFRNMPYSLVNVLICNIYKIHNTIFNLSRRFLIQKIAINKSCLIFLNTSDCVDSVNINLIAILKY